MSDSLVYVVTNREIDESNEKDVKFGKSANPKGIDELRLAWARRDGDTYDVEVIDETGLTHASAIEDKPSYRIFRELNKTMREKQRNCVFFVHGYNTNFKDALTTAFNVRDYYDVEVILFSWPSVGGGEGRSNIGKDFIGTASYKADKRTAANSVVALDRCFEILNKYISKLTDDEDCNQQFTLLCHSMGNYLLKHLLKHSIYEGETLLFDNIVLCAADINNQNHEAYIDKIAHRRRLYVTINENDFALAASRAKLGDKQKARLGHYTRNLVSRNAIYLDFTYADKVGKSHSYFSDIVPSENENVHTIFKTILNGKRGERDLTDFDPIRNIYSIQ